MRVTDPILKDLKWDDIDIDHVLENSYRDFHTKGIDYICLQRGPLATIKVYFFEDGIENSSEVVNPHDHRYNFVTECISGVVRNKWYTKKPKTLRPGGRYSAFTWDTPLNGGEGFAYSHEAMLWQEDVKTIGPGGQYVMSYDELHTIQVLKPETCIVLLQGIDRVAAGKPTWTYCSKPEEPSINHLYNRFTADQALKRIDLLKDLINL